MWSEGSPAELRSRGELGGTEEVEGPAAGCQAWVLSLVAPTTTRESGARALSWAHLGEAGAIVFWPPHAWRLQLFDNDVVLLFPDLLQSHLQEIPDVVLGHLQQAL